MRRNQSQKYKAAPQEAAKPMTLPQRLHLCQQPSDEKQAALMHLCQRYLAIYEAGEALHEYIDDLNKDWDIRTETFWGQVLDTVQAVRAAAQSFLMVLEQPLPSSMLPTNISQNRHNILIRLDIVDRCVDKVGISLAAYSPVCTSRGIGPLQLRREVLSQLKDLAQSVQRFLNMTEVQDLAKLQIQSTEKTKAWDVKGEDHEMQEG